MVENTDRAEGTVHRAGLFDIRFIIAALIGIYGLVLVVASAFTSDKQMAKADGLNLNLYAGLGMLVVAAAFGVWARVRPIVVPADADDNDAPAH